MPMVRYVTWMGVVGMVDVGVEMEI